MGSGKACHVCLAAAAQFLHDCRQHRLLCRRKRPGATLARIDGVLIDAAFNELTGTIIGAAIEVHRHLGPGLLESTYRSCLEFELASRGARFTKELRIPILYKGLSVGGSYRVDVLVEDLVVVETKSVDRLVPLHEAQLLTYLRLVNAPVGLLINFNVVKLTDGVKRVLNAKYVGPDDRRLPNTRA